MVPQDSPEARLNAAGSCYWRSVFVAFLLVPLAACIAHPERQLTADVPTPEISVLRPRVVVAMVDEGILPYHREFASDAVEAMLPPVTYLRNYSIGAIALNLTLNAPDLTTALADDQAAWTSIAANKLYWVPGTKVVGLIGIDAPPATSKAGTMRASRLAGNTLSIAGPEVLLVEVIYPPGADPAKAIRWAADQPWIDLQVDVIDSTFLCPSGAHGTTGPTLDAIVHASQERNQPVVVALDRTTSGCLGRGFPTSVITVGALDNDRAPGVQLPQPPDVAADDCGAPAVDPDRLVGEASTGRDPAAAAAFVGGAAAKAILEARRILGDNETGVRPGGVLAKAAPNSTLPAKGPLMGGFLNSGTLRELLLNTASSPITVDPEDGTLCADSLAWTPATLVPSPALWASVGMGEVNRRSAAYVVDVLAQRQPAPFLRAEWKITVWTNAARGVVWQHGSPIAGAGA